MVFNFNLLFFNLAPVEKKALDEVSVEGFEHSQVS
jgi:hypothetical protein